MTRSRRRFLKESASMAALSAIAGIGAGGIESDSAVGLSARAQPAEWPVTEGPDTPKICMGSGRSEERMRKVKQLGVDHVFTGMGGLPWDEERIRELKESCEAGGLKITHLFMGGMDNLVYGSGDLDETIENVQRSVRAAGAQGIRVVEYDWYADRLMEGYYEMEGRGGAGYTAYDYDPVRDLPPDPEIGVHTARELWDRLSFFLKAVVPVAEQAGVRLALHPNDPPAPRSHGSDQIMATFEDWKRLLDIVESPSNGMTCDPGVATEMGLDPLEVARYMGERDQLNHVHYRNVITEIPLHKYAEVFPDNGQADMFAFMRELVRQGYNHLIYPEHPRALDYDREHGEGISGSYADVGGGGYAGMAYNIAYTRAMLQAALIVEGKV